MSSLERIAADAGIRASGRSRAAPGKPAQIGGLALRNADWHRPTRVVGVLTLRRCALR
jgi:hypothetical protein